MLVLFLVIEIGLEKVFYFVDEGSGEATVCVKLFKGQLERDASFNISTVATELGKTKKHRKL